MIGWPAAAPDGSFAETGVDPAGERVRDDRIVSEVPGTTEPSPSINSQPRQDWRRGDLVASSAIGGQKLACVLLAALSCLVIVRLGKTDAES
jgi:hypothetical protein